MIKITNVEVLGWEHAIRGMRNPLNSWDKSDSLSPDDDIFYVGANDLTLMQKLINAGNNHSKFRRMITVYADITAPLYWWKEYDTYKVGTVANSCSTMHKIHEKKFTLDKCFEGKRVMLNFGAVDWYCRVFINGKLIGEHKGGYVPFSFDITDYLTDGENTLNLRVFDPTDKAMQPRGKQATKSHGFWYTSTTGIWQTVWLEPVNETYIKNLKFTPDMNSSLELLSNVTEITGDIVSDGKYNIDSFVDFMSNNYDIEKDYIYTCSFNNENPVFGEINKIVCHFHINIQILK